ncbi:MAG: discoidin domain-containing protein [Polyangiaceae bacterium]
MASRLRALGWLRGSASRHAPAGSGPLSPRCSELIGRAQLANVLAERAFRPADELPFLGGEAVACELSRQAVYWALLAYQARESPAAASEGETSLPALDGEPLSALWSRAERERLDRAADGREQAEHVRRDLLGKSFADFAELSASQQAALAVRLHAFAARLIEPLALPQRELERAWVRRVLRVMAAPLVLLGLGFGAKALHEKHELKYDLAPTATWKASSRYNECSCESPEQSCAACPNFFFCTVNEDQPSIIFDLGKVQSLSTVIVENRRDCCEERALPLVVQVSTDDEHWKTVATREEAFATWRQGFPTEHARWVKLYVARHDFLHLARVRLLP